MILGQTLDLQVIFSKNPTFCAEGKISGIFDFRQFLLKSDRLFGFWDLSCILGGRYL